MGESRAQGSRAGRAPADRRAARPPRRAAGVRHGAAAALLAGLGAALAATPPAGGQVLDAAWSGREQAAIAFRASLEKERQPADWSGAQRELERCIEISPEPSWEASIEDGGGRWRRHYLPYFYLGRARWNAGDCAQAVESLATSLAKGEVCRSKQGEVRELEKLLVKCEQRGAGPARPARELVRSECAKVQVAGGPAIPRPGWRLAGPAGPTDLIAGFDRPFTAARGWR